MPQEKEACQQHGALRSEGDGRNNYYSKIIDQDSVRGQSNT